MRRRANHGGTAEDGYALLDLMLGLMLIALLAALALPGLARGTGPAALRVSAYEISALLREDRNVAVRSGKAVTTMLTANGLRSGASGLTVTAPANAAIKAPARIAFLPDGRTSGASIVISSETARVIVAVNPDTGAIRVVEP